MRHAGLIFRRPALGAGQHADGVDDAGQAAGVENARAAAGVDTGNVLREFEVGIHRRCGREEEGAQECGGVLGVTFVAGEIPAESERAGGVGGVVEGSRGRGCR